MQLLREGWKISYVATKGGLEDPLCISTKMEVMQLLLGFSDATLDGGTVTRHNECNGSTSINQKSWKLSIITGLIFVIVVG